MFATLCLLAALQAPSQTGPSPTVRPVSRTERRDAGEWLLTPQLAVGQELVYRGSFVEQAVGRNVVLNRAYKLENRIFGLEFTIKGTEAAVLTLVKDETPAGRAPDPRTSLKPVEPEARSARLEKLLVDRQGRLTPPTGTSLAIPLEGPPTLETSFCVPVPSGRMAIDTPWTVQESGRPATTWRIAGVEIAGGASCLKIVGEQKSDDWDKPRADGTAWRRIEAVWVSPRNGIAQRVERRIEHRPGGRTDILHSSVLNYELFSSTQYPQSLSEDRRRDIHQTIQLQQTARPLLAKAGGAGPQLDPLIARARAALDAHARIAYREALVQLKQRLEAARRGEAPPSLPLLVAPEPEETVPRAVSVGKPAPDFIAADLVKPGTSLSLRALKGKPSVLIFFNPVSRNLESLMNCFNERGGELSLVGLVLTTDKEALRKLTASGRWKAPVLDGGSLKRAYGVDCTPRLVFLDAEGVVRGIVVGWGDETRDEIAAALSRILRR